MHCSSAQTRRKGKKNRQQDEMLLLDGSRLVPLSAVVVEVAFITAIAAASILSSLLGNTAEDRGGTQWHSKAKKDILFNLSWHIVIIRIVIQVIINCAINRQIE